MKILALSILIFSCCTVASSQPKCGPAELFTSRQCLGDDVSAQEMALFELVNDHRAANGLPRLTLSRQLSMLANRRMLDLDLNMKKLTHSWSNCAYDINDQRSWSCLLDSPVRLKTGYPGQALETLYQGGSSAVDPPKAIESWKRSSLHNSIILNRGSFASKTWDGLGVGISGQFAVLWFGDAARGTGRPVTLDAAIAGLEGIFTFKESGRGSSSWSGNADRLGMRVEFQGKDNDLLAGNISIEIDLVNRTVTVRSADTLALLLRNLLPQWKDRDLWLTRSIDQLRTNSSGVPKATTATSSLEMRTSGRSVRLNITPIKKSGYREVY